MAESSSDRGPSSQMPPRCDVYLNAVATANPANDAHAKFLEFIPNLVGDERKAKLIQRLASKAQIEHRYTILTPSKLPDRLDEDGFFQIGKFASTATRMERYRREALPLASRAVRTLLSETGVHSSEITHLVVTSCTGFYAPGLDLDLQKEFGMRRDLERTLIGFMGCYAGFNGLKTAWHIVRSQPSAKVLVVNLEICSLHMQESDDVEKVLGFLQFADGCAASLVTADPGGIQLDRFRNEVFDEGSELIQWKIGDFGFEMKLAMDVPQALGRALPGLIPKLMSGEERAEMRLWAIHPGGRSILDTVEERLELRPEETKASRDVLRNYGNMSSATILFVLKSLLEDERARGSGCAMAFGPGLTVESLRFRIDR